MHPAISISHDSQRGCGWRTVKGALYFVSDGPGFPCGMLPLELKPCATCAAMGLKCRVAPTRGFTWISPKGLFDWGELTCDGRQGPCAGCSMSHIATLERAGLLWIGEKFYDTPTDFVREAQRLGISRRLPHDHIPKGFKIGEDFVLLAHKKAVLRMSDGTDGKLMDYFPGIFQIFKPLRIEVICDGTEDDETIQGYLDRGLSPVKIERN